jgi:DNA mismatch repair protein MutH
MSKPSDLTEGQRAYEARRAAKAGMTLEKWLADKDKRAKTEAAEAAKEAEAVAKAALPEKKGWFGRLLDKAHQPLK